MMVPVENTAGECGGYGSENPTSADTRTTTPGGPPLCVSAPPGGRGDAFIRLKGRRRQDNARRAAPALSPRLLRAFVCDPDGNNVEA